MLGNSEIGPVHPIEMLFCTGSMIISAFLFSNIFSQIANINSKLQSQNIQKQQEIAEINQVLDALELGQVHTHDLMLFYQKTGPSRKT